MVTTVIGVSWNGNVHNFNIFDEVAEWVDGWSINEYSMVEDADGNEVDEDEVTGMIVGPFRNYLEGLLQTHPSTSSEWMYATELLQQI